MPGMMDPGGKPKKSRLTPHLLRQAWLQAYCAALISPFMDETRRNWDKPSGARDWAVACADTAVKNLKEI